MTDEVDPLAGIEDEEFQAIEASGLSARHRQFVLHYLRTHSAAKAARLCGYAKPYHHSAGAIMERPAVRELIGTLLSARLHRLAVTPARIEEELAKKAFGSLANMLVIQEDGSAYINMSHATAEDIAGIKSFSCEVELRPGGEDGPRQVQKMRIEREDSLAALGKLMAIHKMAAGEGPTVVVDIAGEIQAARRRAGLKQGEVE